MTGRGIPEIDLVGADPVLDENELAAIATEDRACVERMISSPVVSRGVSG